MAVPTTVLDRLKSQLLTSGLQQKNNALFQVIDQLIGLVRGIVTASAAAGGDDTLGSVAFAEVLSTANQAPGVTTPVQVTFNTQGLGNKFNFASNALTATANGFYKVIFIGQTGETGAGIVNIDIWFRINGTDVSFSNNRNQVSLTTDHKQVTVDSIITMNSGDVLTVFMSVDDATKGAGLYSISPAGEAVIPSAMLLVNKISD